MQRRRPDAGALEVRRVLRPGGSLLFIEHGRAPEPGVRWQDRLTPLWRRLAGGCHLNRPIDRLIARAGLRLAELETGYLVKGPRVATYHYRGRAVSEEPPRSAGPRAGDANRVPARRHRSTIG